MRGSGAAGWETTKKSRTQLEATIVGKYSAVAPVLDERSRRRWAAAESAAIGYGGDALVSSATGLARETIRKWTPRDRKGLTADEPHSGSGRRTSGNRAGPAGCSGGP